MSIFRYVDIATNPFIILSDLDGDGTVHLHVVSAVDIIGIQLDECSRTDEDRLLVEWNFYVVIPTATIEAFSSEEIDPQTFRQVDVTLAFIVHHRTDEELVAKVVFIVNVPYLSIVWIVHQQGT